MAYGPKQVARRHIFQQVTATLAHHFLHLQQYRYTIMSSTSGTGSEEWLVM